MGGSDREIVRQAFEAFSRDDIDGVLELCDPEIVVRDPQRTGTTFRGPDGLRLRDGKFVEYRIYTNREDAVASMYAAD